MNQATINARSGNTISIGFANTGLSPVNYSINGIAAHVVVLNNVDQSTPVATIQSAANASNTTSLQVPSSLLAEEGSMILTVINSGASTSTFTPSAGYFIAGQQQISTSHAHGVSFREIAVASNQQPGFSAAVAARLLMASVKINPNAVSGSCGFLLPIVFRKMEVKNLPQGHEITWETDGDVARSFVIQRSADGQTFYDLASLQGQADRRFVDSRVPSSPSEWFYRILAKTADGEANYSLIVKIKSNTGQGARTRLFPNPAGTNTNLMLEEKAIEVRIIASDGRVMRRMTNLQPGSLTIDTDQLSTGYYQVQVVYATRSERLSLVKQ
jgi:hypothetical protein